jgi:ABC-type oligopeptide transport system substrate-binding subunit
LPNARRPSCSCEARAKIVYERLINVTDDPRIREALGFLMTREIAHQKVYENRKETCLFIRSPTFTTRRSSSLRHCPGWLALRQMKN